MPTYNLRNMHFSPVETVQCYLSTAFTWECAPFGGDYWFDQSQCLTTQGLAAWKYMKELYMDGVYDFSLDELVQHINGIVDEPVNPDEPIPPLDFDKKYILRYRRGYNYSTGGYKMQPCNGYLHFVHEGHRYLLDGDLCVRSFDNLPDKSKHSSSDTIPDFLYCPRLPDKIPFGTVEECGSWIVKSEVENSYPLIEVLINFFDNKQYEHPVYKFDDNNLGAYLVRRTLELLYCVMPVEGKYDHVSIYKNYKDALRGRRTELKIGRAIRHMFPQVSDVLVEAAAKEFTDTFAPREFDLKIGRERADFKVAYSDKLSKSRNPYTTDQRKSLHNSCMRGIEVGHGVSPAEVYASGEFHIAYLTDEKGRIAGRVVVWDNPDGSDNKRPQAGPCYGVCEQSLDKLEQYLDSINAVKYDDGSSWKGAKVLYLDYHGSIVGPYSDMECDLRQDGEYLVYDNYGDVSFSSTSGYAEGHAHCCDCCGETYNPEYEGAYVDDYGDVCDSCLDCSFVFTDSGWIHQDYAVQVYYRSGNATNSEWRHEEGGSHVYCECVDQYWDENDTTYSEAMDEFVPCHKVDDFPEYFPQEEEEEGEAA